VLDCQCRQPDGCHVEDVEPPFCAGFCPEGTACEMEEVFNPDGTLDICCECRAQYDLGDAPDSTNNYFLPMEAYPGIEANYPTVFNDGSGLGPYGPLHQKPQTVAYLGSASRLTL
jgi:hypothetical protein